MSWLAVTVILLSLGKITLVNAVFTLVGCQLISALVALRVVVRSGALRKSSLVARTRETETWRFARHVFVGVTIRDWNVYLDQLILGLILPHRELGIYAVAAGLTLALSLLSAPITTTTQPIVQSATSTEIVSTACGLFAATLVLVGVVALLLALASPIFVPLILGNAYLGAVRIIQILAVGVVLDAMNSCLHGVLLGVNAPASSSRSAALGLLVNVVGWTALLPHYGILGAAITSDLAYAAVTVSMAIAVRRRLPGATWGMLGREVAHESLGVPRRLRQLFTVVSR
jgi:O-antigen/teichoic acid export membrane protein